MNYLALYPLRLDVSGTSRYYSKSLYMLAVCNLVHHSTQLNSSCSSNSLGRNKLTGTIPTELGQLKKLTSLSLQHNDLSGKIPQSHLKNLRTLTALQLEGNEKLHGKIERHSLLCQMRNKCKWKYELVCLCAFSYVLM